MGTRKKKKLSRNCRNREKLLFHYPLFLPGDKDAVRQSQFTKSYIRLTEWMLAAREQKLRKRATENRVATRAAERKYRGTVIALEVLGEAISRHNEPSFDVEELRKRFFASGLTKDELMEVLNRTSRPPTPTELFDHAGQEEDLAAREAALRQSARQVRRTEQHLRDDRAVLDAVTRLYRSAIKSGDEEAAKALHAAAQSACAFLSFLAKQRPDLLRPIARISQGWPLLVQVLPGSLEKSQAKMERLEVGADTIYARLRRDRAFDDTTPARAYARILVETIWTNRLLIPELSERLQAMQLMDSALETDFEELPEWFRSIAGLPAFSTASVNQWGKAAREILRTEQPDFHLRPEWASVRRAFHAHERGRIQNKILYNVVSAMRTIARAEETLPKAPPTGTQILR